MSLSYTFVVHGSYTKRKIKYNSKYIEGHYRDKAETVSVVIANQ